MDNQSEIGRVRTGMSANSLPLQGTVVWLVAKCPGAANSVLAKARETLEVVLSQNPAEWPTVGVWRSILPKWFVEQCAEEISQAEAERRLRLPIEERLRLGQRWSVEGWVHWFQPSERYWQWWEGIVEDEDTLRIGLLVEELTFPYGALEWLLKASGASSLEEV